MKLRTVGNIADYWLATTPLNLQRIHVIVELPSGKRCVDRVSIVLNLVIVRIPARSKWQDVNSHYHSANLVFFLPFASGCHLWILLSTWFKIKLCQHQSLASDLVLLRPGDHRPLMVKGSSLHSNIRNREDLRPHLFRKVVATQADYAELQAFLNDLHSDRNSPDDRGSRTDVEGVKINFLLSPAPAGASSPTTMTMIRRQASRTMLYLNRSSHAIAAFWTCQLWGSRRR